MGETLSNAEQSVRAFMDAHRGQWMTAREVAKGTGCRLPVAEDFLLIMALDAEIDRKLSAPGQSGHLWRMP